MSLTTFNKQSNQLIVNNNVVQDSCTEIYGKNNKFLIKDCNNGHVDQEFIHSLFSQLSSDRKMHDRLKEDFGVIDDIDEIDSKHLIKLDPLQIGFENINKYTLKKIKSKKNNTKKIKRKKAIKKKKR